MLKLLLAILVAMILIPVLIAFLLLFFSFSMIAKARQKRTFSKSKPKGTVEILPPEETDVELEGKLNDLKDRKVRKDKFREL